MRRAGLDPCTELHESRPNSKGFVKQNRFGLLLSVSSCFQIYKCIYFLQNINEKQLISEPPAKAWDGDLFFPRRCCRVSITTTHRWSDQWSTGTCSSHPAAEGELHPVDVNCPDVRRICLLLHPGFPWHEGAPRLNIWPFCSGDWHKGRGTAGDASCTGNVGSHQKGHIPYSLNSTVSWKQIYNAHLSPIIIKGYLLSASSGSKLSHLHGRIDATHYWHDTFSLRVRQLFGLISLWKSPV